MQAILFTNTTFLMELTCINIFFLVYTKCVAFCANTSFIDAIIDLIYFMHNALVDAAPVTAILGGIKNSNRNAGIVLSHKLYPWTYRNGIEHGNITFITPKHFPATSNLWFTVTRL